ncbi:MAG: ABC transporter substrate-binding protein [Candidatus Tectomicrobia bacterium]|nr:ABC transporter substrate-binding protein [Candidatus Tectomicrobia bacterium]
MAHRKNGGARKLGIGCLVLTLALGVAVSAAAQTPKKLQLGIMRMMGLAPVFSGADRGFYKEQGLDLLITDLRGGSVILPAISGGSIDIGFSNVVSVFIAVDQGFDYLAVAGISYEGRIPQPGTPLGYAGTTAIMVLEDSPIKSLKDLEGKTIAVNTLRNILTITIQEMMDKQGAKANSVKWIEVPFPRMDTPLKMKQTDAIVTVQPFVPIFQDKHKFRIIDYPLAGVSKELFPISVWVARKSWVQENQDLLARFRTANQKSIEYINAHPEERRRAVIEHLKMNPALVDKVAWNNWDWRLHVGPLQHAADLSFKWKLIEKKMDVRSLIAP